MSTNTHSPLSPADFWSMSYRGHEIAVLRHHTGWLVYLNTVKQVGMRFAEARSAANWLRRQVDERAAVAS